MISQKGNWQRHPRSRQQSCCSRRSRSRCSRRSGCCWCRRLSTALGHRKRECSYNPYAGRRLISPK